MWFYDVEADGWSLDDKRKPLLPVDKLGAAPNEPLLPEEHAKNNLPDALLDGWNATARNWIVLAQNKAFAFPKPTSWRTGTT